MKQNKILIPLIIVVIFSIIIILISKIFYQKYDLTNLLYDISISIISAFIFYIFQVYIPQKNRNNIIINNFKERYKIFKQDSIEIFLSLYQEYSKDKIDQIEKNNLKDKLLEAKNFKDFFKQNSKIPKQNKWDSVCNAINYNNKYNIDRFLFLTEIFKNDVDFLINNSEIHNKEVFNFLRRLSDAIYDLKNINYNDDIAKQLEVFVWPFFSGWNFVDGYKDENPIDQMINKI